MNAKVKDKIFKVNEKIIIRYEPCLKAKELIILHPIKGKMFEGNKDTYEILKQMNGELSVEEITKIICEQYQLDFKEALKKVIRIIKFLVEKEVIYEY